MRSINQVYLCVASATGAVLTAVVVLVSSAHVSNSLSVALAAGLTAVAAVLAPRAARGIDRWLLPLMGVAWAVSAGVVWSDARWVTGGLALLTAVALIAQAVADRGHIAMMDGTPQHRNVVAGSGVDRVASSSETTGDRW
ncbi:hypothetical protein [Aeromicrobium duanguangcaii]|uniref:SPW repeat-containing protein n=1 Tax=Aeromicrobium duanguangcaii TaxID=2968086 RepID=A0ABY5KL63_9ACTN|nr:hypothetical protein [Aeromicrobium duanguangcaii]MCD9153124.1 hypothetical protein [Aeromicrobium duanguangcaii]UUI69775.1 hypothetical protein NP095_06690 [Aeromicrobium duanguangcaii]